MNAATVSGRSSGARRLAAVAFVDIVGYTILMARDEAATHALWMRLLDDIIRPFASRHNGRFVKSTGDGALTEFPSALDAVRWAEEVQLANRGMTPRGQEIEPITEYSAGAAEPLALRIAVHLGDVVTTEFDIYGDGVNVAARLQEHASPGGIIISGAVHDLVRGAFHGRLRDLGRLMLKNLAEPVHAFGLDLGLPAQPVPERPRTQQLPSIAVLPLRNLGGSPDDGYFAEGLVEDIIASLSGLSELFVISHSSAIAIGDRPVEPRQVGHALGVRYVMTGSLRRMPNRLRVTINLWDVEAGNAIWAETAEVPPDGVFDVQDDIVRKIISGIAPNIASSELRRAMRKRPGSFTAYDHTLRALHLMHDLEREKFNAARTALELAIVEDGDFTMAIAWLARWHSLAIGQGWSGDPGNDAAAALAFSSRAINQDPRNALALATFAHVKSFLFHDYDAALAYFERALAASPNHALAWILSSLTLAYVGRGEDAVRHAAQGLRLSPMDKGIYFYYTALAYAHFSAGNAEAAARWSRLATTDKPGFTSSLRVHIAALAATGDVPGASAAAQRLLQLEPSFTLSEYQKTRQPFRHAEIRARYLENLRAAGLPP